MIIEVKCRQHCFPKSLHLYERIQGETYLRLFNKQRIVFVEKVGNGNDVIKIKEVERDDDLWNNVILPRLDKVLRVSLTFYKETSRKILRNSYFLHSPFMVLRFVYEVPWIVRIKAPSTFICERKFMPHHSITIRA